MAEDKTSPEESSARAAGTPPAPEAPSTPANGATPPAAEAAAPEPPLEDQLRDKLKAREKELEDQKDRFLRLAADFDNFKKRAFKERAELVKYAHENLVKQLLDGIDNLERARAHETADKDALLAGVGLVESIFLQALERFGVKRFSAVGQPFDPAFHEAVQEVVAADAPPGSVMFELQKGYTYHDRLLRPSRVVLAKQPDKVPERVPDKAPTDRAPPDRAPPDSVEIDLEAELPEGTGTLQS